MCRFVLAFLLQSDQDQVEFDVGVVEVDGARLYGQRSVRSKHRKEIDEKCKEYAAKKQAPLQGSKEKVTIHRGRFLIIKHCEPKKQMILPMQAKATTKGSASPPENKQEVLNRVKKHLDPKKHIVGADAGLGIKEALQALGVPVATANHGAKHMIPLVTMSRSLISKAVVSWLRKKRTVIRVVKKPAAKG